MTNRPRYTERDLFRPMNRLRAIDGFRFFFRILMAVDLFVAVFKRYWKSEK